MYQFFSTIGVGSMMFVSVVLSVGVSEYGDKEFFLLYIDGYLMNSVGEFLMIQELDD